MNSAEHKGKRRGMLVEQTDRRFWLPNPTISDNLRKPEMLIQDSQDILGAPRVTPGRGSTGRQKQRMAQYRTHSEEQEMR